MITTDSVSVMGSWLQEAIERIRVISRRAPVHLAHASDGWSLQVYTHVPVGKASDPALCAEVGVLVPVEVVGGGMGLGRTIAPGQEVALPEGPLALVCEGDDLVAGDVRIPTTSAILHPGAPVADAAWEITLERAAIERLAVALTGVASRDLTRPDLCALHLLGSTAVATDSYSLRQVDVPAPVPEPVDVSRPFFERVAREARRDAITSPVRLARHGEHTLAWLNDELYVASAPCRPLALSVPSLFPVWSQELGLAREEWIAAVAQVAGDSDDPITVSAAGDTLAVGRPDEANGAVRVAGQGAAEIPTLGLNPAFLLANLRATADKSVTLHTTDDPLRPIGISGAGIQMLQMPIRL